MNPNVDEFLKNLKKWKPELTLLRGLILECNLNEDFKWKHPCYTDNGKNIVLIHGFKDYCAILFPKGALLKDAKNLLIQQTENVQSGRQIRFTNLSEIESLKSTLIAYIKEAIENERAGKKIEQKTTSEYKVPLELEEMFSENQAFNNLTPGRQRGYLLHFEQPKQSNTKRARIEKNLNRILSGYGLNDCVCGLSKRLPNCDGSHKQLK